VVLNIVVEESRLFLTKERAPYMICLEVFRPDEIKHSLEEKETNEEPFHISMQNLKKMFKHAKFKGKQFGMKLEKQADKRISKPVLVGRGHKDEFQEVASDSDG